MPIIKENIKMCMDITEEDITVELIDILLNLHQQIVSARFNVLDNYYQGKHDILLRTIEDATKPNNKPVTNFCSYITDTLTGFFVGKPVSYTSIDKEYLGILSEIFKDNDEQAENHDLGHKASIKGQSFELVYMDEAGDTCFDCLDTDGVIMIYDTTIKNTPCMALRYYTVHNYVTSDDTTKIDIYTRTNAYHYTKGESLVLDSSEEHYFGIVPIVEYANNRYRRGDFENIIPLNDMYNKNNADISNDIEYFSNAYLVLENMDGTETEDITKINENRVILTSENGKAYFLTKQLNDAVVQNHRNNLSEDIHKIAYVPDLSKEINSNVSGSALKTKMFTTADIIVNKERKFKKSLETRIKLITTMLNLKGYKKNGVDIKTHDYNYKDIVINFHRNMPVGLYETADDISKMSTVVTKKTLLTEIGIEDVQAELDQLDNEQNAMVDLENLHTIDTIPIVADTIAK